MSYHKKSRQKYLQVVWRDPSKTSIREYSKISPIDCVPKKSPGDFRLIHHLSYSPGSSINDGIMRELASVSYCSFDDAVNALLKLGRGALVCKTDIKSAFRLIPVHPSDQELLEYKWQSKYYYDFCLPFGYRSSQAIFEQIKHRNRMDCEKAFTHSRYHTFTWRRLHDRSLCLK